MVKSPPANARDVGDASLLPGWETSSGGGHGNSLQYSCLEKFQGQRMLEGYSSWTCKRVRHN